MNMIIIFYVCALVDLFFIHLLLYFNFRRLGFIQVVLLNIEDLLLNQLREKVRSKSKELVSRLQDIKDQIFKTNEHPTDEHPFFEPKINKDKK